VLAVFVATSSTKQDILGQLLKQGQTSAQDLAERLQISPQAVRRHLKDLEDEGLIAFQSIQTGMGRPQHLYQLSPHGRAQFPNHHDQFAVGLLDTLADTVGKEQMQAILRQQWQRKALDYRQRLGQGPLAERVASLVKLRQDEGYMAEFYPALVTVNGSPEAIADPTHREAPEKSKAQDSNQFILTEHNCAISKVAQSFPGVCDHELEMFALALGDCKVERTHWLINGEHRCCYLIQSQV
jgi:DeoR family transcriptional regulator, suf operon transcriptional repressor